VEKVIRPAPIAPSLVPGQVYTVDELKQAQQLHGPRDNGVRGMSVHAVAVILAGNRQYDDMMKAKRGY
jgi:hypothetical protein